MLRTHAPRSELQTMPVPPGTFRERRRPLPGGPWLGSLLLLLLLAGCPCAGELAHSPDGRTLARAVPRGEPFALFTELWIAQSDGTGAHRIKSYLGGPGDLCYHPDGRELVFLQHSPFLTAYGSHLASGRHIPLARNRVWRVSVDGSGENLWPLPDDLQAMNIAVSPNGRKLAVGGFRGDLLDGSDRGLWIVDLRGEAVRLVTGHVQGALVWTSDSREVTCTVSQAQTLREVTVDVSEGEAQFRETVPQQLLGRGGSGSAALAQQLGAFAALVPKDQQNVHRALGTVGRIRHYYRRAHHTMHGCDYPPMKRDFKRAMGALKSLHKSKLGFSKADCRAYAGAIEDRLDLGTEKWEALACQEHMLVLRDLAEDYARAHDGDPPPNLDELREWVEQNVRQEAVDSQTRARDLELIPVLFRCASDEVPAYRSSYVYRREACPGSMMLSAFCHEGMAFHIVGDPGGYGVRAQIFESSQVDSLEAVADRCLADGKVDRAIHLLEGVANQRRDGSSFARLGHVHLAEERFDIAEMVFEKALSEGKKEDIAEAFYGLGLVNMDLPGGGVSKIGLGVAADYFSEALARNPEHKEARFRRARARFLMGWAHESREELEEFLRMYPDHADAVLLMGNCYADLAEKYGKAIVWYTRYLSLRPGDADAERRLRRAYGKLKDYDDIVTSLQSFLGEHPQAIGIMPAIAQACIKKGKQDLALELLERYLSTVDSQDGRLDGDLALRVIPLPTRTSSKAHSLYVYHDIRNLARNVDGQARYQVQHTVRPTEGTGSGAIVAQLDQTFTGKKREGIGAGHEQVGLKESEAAYVELDLGESRPGRYELRVEVTDLNTERVTAQETTFAVEE